MYYGCCEPLDRKIDIVRKLPNLRKISITPWADVKRAAEQMGSDFVMARKPNPAMVAVPELDEAAPVSYTQLGAAGHRANVRALPADIRRMRGGARPDRYSRG